MGDYTEHLISMAGGNGEPDALDKKSGWDCHEEVCTKTAQDGLYRVNPKGQKGIFMCTTHARQANQPPVEPRFGL